MADIPTLRCGCLDHRYVNKTHTRFYNLGAKADTFTAVPVFVASNRLAIVVQTSLFLSLVGMALTLFVTTGMHQHTNEGSFLVQANLGTSGWNSGTAWMLGIANCMYAFGATDGGRSPIFPDKDRP